MKQLFFFPLLCILSLILPAKIIAQFPKEIARIPSPDLSSARFVENKGQWGDWFAYRLQCWQGSVLYAGDRFIYELYDNDYMDASRSHEASHKADNKSFPAHNYQAQFLNANKAVKIEQSNLYPDYQNYFLGENPERWKTKVAVSAGLNYKQLYTGIDMQVYGKEANITYDFYIKAHSDPAQIQIAYQGIENMRLVKGDLVLETSVGQVKELAPTAYQIIDEQKIEVACQYVLTGKVLSFDFPNGYDVNKDLVIDPTLIFSTYTGSTQDNWGFTATYDHQGNGYAGGIIFDGSLFGIAGQGGYPTMGAYQTVFQGGQRDAVITKFNPTGTGLIFSTYLGGSNIDQPHSMVVDKNGNLFVFGRTSSGNFPLLNGYDVSANGGYDIFIAKFSPTGQLLASTLLGGSGDDAKNISDDDGVQTGLKYNYGDDARGEVIVDAANNVYIASCTYSSNFPVTAGSFRTNYSGGQDGLIAKFNNDLNSLIWASYIGGNGDDAAYSLQLDNQENVFVTGGTQSYNFPTTAGAYKTSFGGAIDGFLSKISNNGTSLISSTFIGTSSYDQSYFVQLDYENAVYVVGQTLGSFPKSAGTYGTTGGNQFIAKLTNDLSAMSISTTYGSASSTYPNISPTAFLVDICKNVYVCGWGDNTGSFNFSSGTSSLPSTQNIFPSHTPDGNDFHIIVLQNDLQSLLFATFFGGSNSEEHVDGGTSRFDKDGIIYEAACASCGGNSSSFPHTPGAWSQTNNSSNCNLALFKIQLDLVGMKANFQAENSSGGVIQNYQGCAPLPVFFNNLTNGNNSATTTYVWNFGDGTATSTLTEPTHTFTTAGVFQVMLVAHDPNACNEYDTTYRSITIWDKVNVDAGTAQFICGSQTAALQATATNGNPGFSYQWTPATGLNSTNVVNPIAHPGGHTLYTVNVTDSKGCTASDTVRVYVDTLLVKVPVDTFFCVGASVQLHATAYNAISYSWTPATGLNATNIANPIASPSATTQYTVTVWSSEGCDGKGISKVEIKPLPAVSLGPDKQVCNADTVFLQATSPTAISYLWQPASFLNSPTIANPFAVLTDTQTYTVHITDTWGCQNTDNITIFTRPQIPLFIKPDTIICQGANVQLYALSTDNALTYQWLPPTFLNNSTISNPFATSPSNILYTLIVRDTVGCERKDSTRITIFETFTIADTMICLKDTISLQTIGGVSFVWTPNSYLSNPNIASPLASPPNNITYTVTATSNKGCVSTKSVAIQVHALPTPNAGQDAQMCLKDTIQLQGSGGGAYLWTPNVGLSNNLIANPFSSPPATGNYILTVTDDVGCKNKDSVHITVFPLPQVLAGNAATICMGDTVPLFATGAISYAWSPNAYISDSTSANPFVFPKRSIDYIVTGTDANGCKDTAVVPITLRFDGITQIQGPDVACPGHPITLTASGGQQYVWNTLDTTASITVLPTASQWFTCIGYNNHCAAVPDSIYVTLLVMPQALFTIPDSAFAPVYVSPINQSLYADTYQWEWGDLTQTIDYIASPTHTYQHGGEYTITLVAYNYRGCSDTITHKIVVEDVTIFVPSVFTPNNDNSNDFFLSKSYGIQSLNLEIYSRWGMLVFTSNDINFRWDGTYKGQPVPEGVYVWTIDAVGENNRPYKLKGTVTVIR